VTRQHTRRPVWAWYCDLCGRRGDEIAWEQSELPSGDEMRARGWFIAQTWGDKCPQCAIEARP